MSRPPSSADVPSLFFGLPRRKPLTTGGHPRRPWVRTKVGHELDDTRRSVDTKPRCTTGQGQTTLPVYHITPVSTGPSLNDSDHPSFVPNLTPNPRAQCSESEMHSLYPWKRVKGRTRDPRHHRCHSRPPEDSPGRTVTSTSTPVFVIHRNSGLHRAPPLPSSNQTHPCTYPSLRPPNSLPGVSVWSLVALPEVSGFSPDPWWSLLRRPLFLGRRVVQDLPLTLNYTFPTTSHLQKEDTDSHTGARAGPRGPTHTQALRKRLDLKCSVVSRVE